VPPEQKYLKAGSVKGALIKCVKGIAPEDKIIFIGKRSSEVKRPATSAILPHTSEVWPNMAVTAGQ
jgi:hypothetical protein